MREMERRNNSSINEEIKSRMKTEFKAEIKEEAFQEFDHHEQIGMDYITSQEFDTPSNKILLLISLIFLPSKKRSTLTIKSKRKSRRRLNLRQVYNEVWKYWKSLNFQ